MTNNNMINSCSIWLIAVTKGETITVTTTNRYSVTIVFLKNLILTSETVRVKARSENKSTCEIKIKDKTWRETIDAIKLYTF